MNTIEKQPGYYIRAQHPAMVARYHRLLGSAHRLLDIGSGPGCVGRFKPIPQTIVYGIDHDRRATQLAAQWEHVLLCDLDQERLPYRDGSFEGVLAKDVLEHLLRPWRMMAEIHRVLTPGGRLLINVPMPRSSVVWNDYTHVRGFTRRALRQLCEDTGFTVLQISPMGGLPGFGRLNLIEWLPRIFSLPLIGERLGVSYEALVLKSPTVDLHR